MGKLPLTTLVLLAACATSPRPRPAPPPPLTSKPLAPPAPEDPLLPFARQHEAEAALLVQASRHYVAHPQVRPPGFRPLTRGSRVDSKRMHHARMIAFNYGMPCGDSVVEGSGAICESAVYPGAELTPAQLTRASEILRLAPDPNTWRARPSVRCFDPHHAVVFFDDHDAPVGEIDVCFECGNFTLTNIRERDGEGGMTSAEGMFFADTCRAQGVGGCPPPGSYRMPDLPPLPDRVAANALSPSEQDDYWRRKSLAEPLDLAAATRLADLSTQQQRLLCAWFASATRRSGHGLECQDGRRMTVQEPSACVTPIARGCEATVGDLMACTRSRLHTYCSVDAPGCAKADTCKKGVLLLP